MEINKVYVGDNIEVLKTFPDNSIDSVVTDPPYGISFMGKKWDYDVPSVELWQEVFRVLKPGGHMLVACGTRTQHRMAVNIEDAGFEIRDIVAWVYGSGFPKSMDVSKAIDKIANIDMVPKIGKWLKEKRIEKGYDRKFVAGQLNITESAIYNWEENPIKYGFPSEKNWGKLKKLYRLDETYDGFTKSAERNIIGYKKVMGKNDEIIYGKYKGGIQNITIPSTDEAKQWQGWGTALKPAMELWTLARKPLNGTVAQNILEYGVGGINIDATRIPFGDETDSRVGTDVKRGDSLKYKYHGIDFEVLKRYENDEDYVWSENLSLSKINVDNIGEFLDGLNMVGYQFQFDLTQYEEIIIDTHLKHIIPVVDTFKNNLDSNSMFGVSGKGVQMYKSDGRFPANFIHDGSDEVEVLFPETKSGNLNVGHKRGDGTGNSFMGGGGTIQKNYGADSGSASRFFYVAKASQEERNFGLYDFEDVHPSEITGRKIGSAGAKNGGYAGMTETPRKNIHPTVKPIELMRYLVRMITPPNGICLDPYLGSGTTAIACEMEKFNYIGIELDEQYVEIAKARVGAVKDYETTLDTKTAIKESIKEDKEKELGIQNIFDFMEEQK